MCDACQYEVQKFNAIFQKLGERSQRSPREYQNPMRRPPRKKMHTGVGRRS